MTLQTDPNPIKISFSFLQKVVPEKNILKW